MFYSAISVLKKCLLFSGSYSIIWYLTFNTYLELSESCVNICLISALNRTHFVKSIISIWGFSLWTGMTCSFTTLLINLIISSSLWKHPCIESFTRFDIFGNYWVKFVPSSLYERSIDMSELLNSSMMSLTAFAGHDPFMFSSFVFSLIPQSDIESTCRLSEGATCCLRVDNSIFRNPAFR